MKVELIDRSNGDLHDLRADGHAQVEAGEVVRQMSLAVACSDVAEVWVNQ